MTSDEAGLRSCIMWSIVSSWSTDFILPATRNLMHFKESKDLLALSASFLRMVGDV